MSARKPRTPVTNGKKRKASELSDDVNQQTPSHSNSATTPRRKFNQAPSTADSNPFETQCPAKPPKAPKDGSAVIDEWYRNTEDPKVPGLHAIDYAIRPGGLWADMKAYKKCKLANQIFTTGSIVYINRSSPAPTPPPEDAPPTTILEYDRTNLWVGRILECRAKDDRNVYLRVFWLYWPEELPMGRQPYHGQKELVMSNAMDIIDAQSIASEAEVSQWNEDDDEADAALGERFWRQKFDVVTFKRENAKSKAARKKGSGLGLSQVKRHCVCETEYNPDNTMFKCPSERCGIWNHEECLVDSILEEVYGQSEQETLDQRIAAAKAKDVETGGTDGGLVPPKDETSLSLSPSKMLLSVNRVGELAGALGSSIKDRFFSPTPDPKADSELPHSTAPSSRVVKKKKPDGSPRPWTGLFTCEVANEDTNKGRGRVRARITQVAPTATKDPDPAKPKKGTGTPKKSPAKKTARGGKEWEEDVVCLRCASAMI